MNTFLPLLSYAHSLECLDDKRLGKQRVEAFTILKVLGQGPEVAFVLEAGKKKLLWGQPLDSGDGVAKTPWYNHPATRMWKGWENGLRLYFNTAVETWVGRGFKNTMPMFTEKDFKWLSPEQFYPDWLTEELCASHRSNLLRKDPKFYSQWGWKEPDNLPYIWSC